MKLKSISIGFSLAVAAALGTLPSHAQNVNVVANLYYVPAAGGVFDYTLMVYNYGPEAVQSLWLGWVPGSFNISNPSNPGNTIGWTSTVDGNSIQYAGTPATALLSGTTSGSDGTFTFDSTTTPNEFWFQIGMAGASTAYGVSAANGQLSFSLSPPDTETFAFGVIPEPSTFALLVTGSLGFLGVLRRKLFLPSSSVISAGCP